MVWPRRRAERRSVVDEASVLEAQVWGYSAGAPAFVEGCGLVGEGAGGGQCAACPPSEPVRASASSTFLEVGSVGDGLRLLLGVRTMAGWAHAIVGGAVEDFQLKRIRSGVETLLAANGVSREVRGRLQSHGLTGGAGTAL